MANQNPRDGAPRAKNCMSLLVPLIVLACVSRLAGAPLGDEPLAQRRQRVEQMSASQFDRLQRQYRQFQAMSPAEQSRLRSLYLELERHPQQAELEQAMRNYHNWVASLSPAARNDLLKAPPDQRMQKVRALRQRGRNQAAGRLNRQATNPQVRSAALLRSLRRSMRPEDLQACFQWLEELVVPQLSEQERQELEATAGGARNALVISHARRQELFAGGRKLHKLSDEQLQGLIRRLSAETRKRFEGLPPAVQRERLAGRLQALVARFAPSQLPQLDDGELLRFFMEELGSEARESIQDLPPAEFRRRLRVLYFYAHPDKARPPGQQTGDGHADPSRQPPN